MNILLIFALTLLSYSCSQVKPKPMDEEVSLNAALNQAQSSYLLGCVEAFKTTKVSPSFPLCRERAIKHRVELEQLLRQIPQPVPTVKPL